MDRYHELFRDRKIDEILREEGEEGITADDIYNYVKSLADGSFYYGEPEECFDEESKITKMQEYFHYDLMGWCGCGCPENADRAVLTYMETLNYGEIKKTKDIHDIYEGLHDPLLLCLMYTLDEKGLTEHGSSVYGAWLTTKGYVFRLVLKRFFEYYDSE